MRVISVATFVLVLAVAALASLAACDGKRSPSNGGPISSQGARVSCHNLRAANLGVEAMLVVVGAFQCFDDRAACGTGCFDVESPRWSCFESSDSSAKPGQPDRWSVCMPSQTLCEKSRTPDTMADPSISQGACTDVAPVFCSSTEHHTLMCSATEAECQQRRDRIHSAETDKLHVNMSPCVPRPAR